MDACQFFMMAFLIPVFEDIWDLSSPWDSLIPNAFVVGILIASLCWSKVADVYGRRKVVIVGMTLMSISTTMTIFVTNIYALLICRFFAGLGYIQPVIITHLLEFSPVNSRGKSMVFAYLC
jgi:putative MFS transporter